MQADEKVYTAECMGKFGFREKWADPKAISFEQFQELGHRWHDRFHQSCHSALRSSNYMRIKNALNILSRVIEVSQFAFPQYRSFCPSGLLYSVKWQAQDYWRGRSQGQLHTQ